MAAFLVCADPGSDVRAVFSARCVTCHGAGLAKPKGGFGFVTDLARVAKDPEKVIPGNLAHSNLWLLVQSGNMPPNGSPTGPLSVVQKDMVKTWIEAGCPPPAPLQPLDPRTEEASAPNPVPAQEDAPTPTSGAGPSALSRTVSFAGNFHLLVLHFPIALIVLAALGEALGWWLGRRPAPAGPIMGAVTQLGVGTLIVAATVAAVPTVVLGWLHAYGGSGSSQPDNLFWHSWLGTGSLVMLGATAWLCWGDAVGRTRRLVTRLAIFGSAAVVGLVGHFGGMMVHGRAFLNW